MGRVTFHICPAIPALKTERSIFVPSIPLLLQNDQILYDALLQAGALSGGDFPPREFLLWQTSLSEEELQLALERFCQQKIL